MTDGTYTTDRRDPVDPGGNVSTPSGINLIAGVWLIVAPFILGYSGAEGALWNDIACGIAGIILAGARLSKPLGSPGASWANAALGVWLIIAPWVIGYPEQAAFWNDVIVGIIFVVFGLWSASATRTTTAYRTPRAT